MNESLPIKVVFFGESGVGKTSIISQFTVNKFFQDSENELNFKFISKIVSFPELGKSMKFYIWDTKGNEKYHSQIKTFCKNAKVIILVYDITNENSFKSIKNFWYEEVKKNSEKGIIFAIIANKMDLNANQRVIDDEGEEFADKIGAIFQSTSALSDFGISTLFDNIGKTILIPGYWENKIQEKLNKQKKKRNLSEFTLLYLSKYINL